MERKILFGIFFDSYGKKKPNNRKNIPNNIFRSIFAVPIGSINICLILARTHSKNVLPKSKT
jgi:hypothetical protein